MRITEYLVALTVTASAAAAQNPPPPPMGPAGPGGDRSAQMLLARSAELDLTDAQVVKLAGIARKAEARRRTMRSAMDSGRTRFAPGQPGDSLARRQFAERMESNMTKEREQARVDLRDAITVLTPDQQARAWEMAGAAARGRVGRGGAGGRGMGMSMGGRAGRMPGARRGNMGPDDVGPGPMGRGRMNPASPNAMPPRRPGAMRPMMRPPIDGQPPAIEP